MIDLTPFCDPEEIRSWMTAPFSDTEYTYATDAKIAIRVPRRAEIAETEYASKAARLFAIPMPSEFFALPSFDLLPREMCLACVGAGRDEDEYEVICWICNGAGDVQPFQPVEIGNSNFQAKYLLLIRDLPNCKIAPNGEKQAHFTFDGGDGLLQPVRV